MSSGKSDKIFQTLMDDSYEKVFDQKIDFSKIVISFSKMFNSHKTIDVYSGTEKIPFKKRDPEYKMILKQEFSHLLTAL